jgi:hypothetical protein
MSAATIATIPKWMRQLGGFDQAASIDAMILPATKIAVRMGRNPMASRMILKQMAPSALPVMEQVLRKQKPLRNEVLSPAEARQRFGQAGRMPSAA